MSDDASPLSIRERARLAHLDREAETFETLADYAEALLVDVLDYDLDELPFFEPKLTVCASAPALEFELEGLRFRARPVKGEPWLELVMPTGSTRLQCLADLGERLQGQPLTWEGDDA